MSFLFDSQIIPSEIKEQIKLDLPKELKTIPKPYFISYLFLENYASICRPLFPPYDRYAITHNGKVFLYKPLCTLKDKYGKLYLNPLNICIPKYDEDIRPMITIQDKGYRGTFYIDRLILDRFYGMDYAEDVEINYLDGDIVNPHINNLEGYYVNRKIN